MRKETSMGIKFTQIKVWPTRRIHLFYANDRISWCGLTERMAGEKIGEVDYPKEEDKHAYDDLRYCQCCRRKADSWTNRKYTPLTKRYENLIKRWEKYIKRK